MRGKLKFRLIFSAVFGLAISFTILYYSNLSADYSLAIGLIIFVGMMMLTSDSFTRWDRARVERNRQQSEEADRWRREDYYRREGQLRAERDFRERQRRPSFLDVGESFIEATFGSPRRKKRKRR